MGLPIYIIIDHDIETSLELAAFSVELSEITGFPLKAIIISDSCPSMASNFSETSGIDVAVLQNDHFSAFSIEGLTNAIRYLLPEPDFSYMIFAHNTSGSGPAAALAALYGISCVTGVESLTEEDLSPCFFRNVWHGKLIEKSSAIGLPAVVTVMPGAFCLNKKTPQRPGQVKFIEIDVELNDTLSSCITEREQQDSPLTSADVIISAGVGAEGAFKKGLINEFAAIFSRSAVGGSRAACDRGFIDYSSQIGMTGKKVSPKLYIACGISGSLQHIAGIKGAGCIAAVNRDPEAPIFRAADIGFVDELEGFIPALLSLIDNEKKRK